MGKSTVWPFTVGAVIVAILLAAAMMAGCSGKSYSLTKDAALVSQWGDTVQYKVDKSWDDSNDATSNDSYCSDTWNTQDWKTSVRVVLSNTDDTTYGYSKDSTYAGWQKQMENEYSKSAEEQAKEINSLSTSATVDADNLTSFSNCQIEDTGTVSVDGQEIRTFSVSYHYKNSDSGDRNSNGSSANNQPEGDITDYYGLIKDGDHDLEVSASDSQLLKDVLSTMTFSW